MHRDPVCRMYIDAETAAIKSEYNGKTYYFCSDGCKKAFDANPEKYAAMSREGGGCCC
jgi:Cu+-exporting ATPase